MGMIHRPVGMPVLMADPIHIHRHKVEPAVTDTGTCDDGIRELAHPSHQAPQYYCLHAVLVIEMHVETGNDKIVVVMLRAGQPAGQLALVVVVNIGEGADTVAIRRILKALRLDFLPDQIAHRLRPVVIAVLGKKAIKLLSQGFVQGDTNALHVVFPHSS